MDTNPRSWLDRLLGMAIVLVVIAVLLRWAWQLLRPLLPVGLGAVVLVALVMVVVCYRRNRYW